MVRSVGLGLLLAVAIAGCGGGGRSDDADGGGSTDPLSATRVACVDRINDLRASVGLGPYARWTDAERCSDDQAESDSNSGQAHGAFGQCGEWAQNECPGWQSTAEIVQGCLQLMWDEGPGGGHYDNMTSTQYVSVACGFFEAGPGEVWAVQNFK